MKCQRCKIREATTHLSKMIMGIKQEIHLCEHCAKIENDFAKFLGPNLENIDSLAKELLGFKSSNHNYDPVNVDLNNLITSFFSSVTGTMPKKEVSTKEETDTCSFCSTSFEEFIKNGKLGCSNCYDAFREKLVNPLKKIHGNITHSGKVPNRLGGKIKIKRKIEMLQNELDQAVLKQDFERAAILRDKIKEIKESSIPDETN